MLPRRRLAGTAVLAALLGMLALPMSGALAAVPSAHAYWWRLQSANGPRLPPPPFVPTGGLWVANDSSGQQQAVSAVRYRAPTGVEIRRLDLRVAQSSGEGALLLACSARASWKPVEAGAWDARPGTRCDVAFVRGVLRGDTWSFDVRGLGRSGTLDVVILPPEGLEATFSIAFERPDVSTIVTERLPGSPSPSVPGPSPSQSQTPRLGGGSAAPSVLGEKTTPPGSPSAASPPGSPLNSPNSSSPGLLARGLSSPGDWRRLAMTTIAVCLAVVALAGLIRYRWPS